MIALVNRFTGDLILPDTTAVRRGEPPVHMDEVRWAEMMSHPVVAAWVDEGRIEVQQVSPAAAPLHPAGHSADDPGEAEPDLDDLRAQAESLGIKVDKRWGAKRLAEEITLAKDLAQGDLAEGESE